QAPGDKEVLHQLRAAIVAVLGIAFAVTLADFLVFLLHVEGVEQLAGSEYAEGLLVEGVKAFHHAAAVDLAAEIIETGKEGLAVGKAIKGDPVQDHILFASAFVGLEWRVA